MIKISRLKIERYRSIIDMELTIDDSSNLVALCGQNNVGKTNTLRAINIFFNPECYNVALDKPEIKHATGGAAIDPKITIEFLDTKTELFHVICRDFKLYDEQNLGLSGHTCNKIKRRVKNGTTQRLTTDQCVDFIGKFYFAYIEAANVNIPDLISKLSNDMIDIEYDGVRFSDSKKALKTAYDAYANGLQDVLDSFASDVSSTFNSFKAEWNIKLKAPKNSERFRDLISNDVELLIDDKGSTGTVQKGSGLQRLAAILLNFEILSRLKKKMQFIVCVDEPDLYLHEGLQKSLKSFFDEHSDTKQIFYSTHSKVFINPFNMKNVFLLSANRYEQYSARKKKTINVTETNIVDIATDDGYNLICTHLGIEKSNYDILQSLNIILEGKCDIKYLTELANYFGIATANMISLNGADKAEKYLDFYESYYYNNETAFIPNIKMIFDNDCAGREAFRKISTKTYWHIKVKCYLLQNCCNDANMNTENNNTNNEIEDLIYPELLCFLVNTLLEKRRMNKIDTKKVCSKISKPSFKAGGILQICEHEKNESNEICDSGFSFTSSGKATNNIKEGLAGIFNVQANREIIKLLDFCDVKYPSVKEVITKIFEPIV